MDPKIKENCYRVVKCLPMRVKEVFEEYRRTCNILKSRFVVFQLE